MGGAWISAVIISVLSLFQGHGKDTPISLQHTQNKPLQLQIHAVTKVSLPPAIFLVTQSPDSLCTKTVPLLRVY